MRLLVSPGALSGALSAAQVAAAVRRGWLRTAPDTEVRALPMSDGAAGLLDAVHTARGGQLVSVTARGPLGEPVPATLLHVPGTGGGTAYVEAGQVLGRQLVPAGQELRHAEEGSSAGLGELLLAARDLGAGRVVVGLGESATHDGGAGLVRTLAGASPEADIDGDVLASAHRVLAGADVVVAAATQVPLLGLHGAGALLADRLGSAEAQRLDTRTGELAARLERLGRGLPARPTLLPGGHEHGGPSRPGRADGAGAGGGAAYALTVLGGRLLHGPDVVATAVGLAEEMARTDVVLTATAVLDAPAVDASVVATVGRAAMELGLPVVVLAEEVHTSRREVARAGISATYETGPGGVDALEEWARRLARTWALGA
ncbi:glycerate kinase [Georgenia satyanarayanai]|uniref:Glycerate kinase n=1 Tax=Georgenia satyanarayanai TaxID=860221 RepID=A0A2Y9BV59_9MICO|nr:glycerate kinase [Georgenia satyanarayanai]PYG01989.1 glycerate kinase [Georgenia satyanarayanai]SSA36792.1 glycerate kinase [Georgenia satyanarayanai]